MAKTYEELLEQAAIIRDETAAGKNTATRVGGTITDAVDYVKELKDQYEGIHAEAADAKAAAAAAKLTAAEAKTNAGSARSIAQSAVLTANAAKQTADEAKAKAEAAQAAAQEAKEKADAVKSELLEYTGDLGDEDNRLNGLISENKAKIASVEGKATRALDIAVGAQTKNEELDARLSALENPPAPDYVEMIVEAPVAKHYALFYDARCLGWLEIDGEEETVPEVTGNRSVKYYAALSPGRHVVRFRPKEGNMSDGTPWKERTGMLGWCSGNQVTEVTLPEGWTVINTKMFEGADSLRRVNLPSTITDVRYGAFGNCAALEEIVLPASVERIEHIIAHDCPALKRIVLGGRNVEINGTLAQTCTELDCVEFRAGGTAAFKTSNNSFINLPKLGRFIIGGNLPSFECDRPFTSTGYVGSSLSADTRWLFTADNVNPSGTVWEASLINICGFTVKGRRSYELV